MAGDEPILYLNGEYIPASSAVVSVEDRGFLFGDACYEVTVVFDGVCIALDRHLARLQRGLDELRIPFVAGSLAEVHGELIRRNSLASHPMSAVYVQVTRGVAPRSHAFPVGAVPTVLVRAQPIAGPSVAMLEAGTRAITAPDIRWGRVDIKTTGLLANVLAQQAAVDAGADDVILHRDGLVTEGSHTNVYGVIDGVLITAPADHRILAGITRGIVLELAASAGITVDQREWTLAELANADEVLMSSTTAGVRPICSIDGVPVAAGTRGPITVSLQAEYRRFVTDRRRSFGEQQQSIAIVGGSGSVDGVEFADDDYYTGPPFNAEMVQRAETAVGFTLPDSYVALLQERNGGVPVRRCWLTDSPTTWADDHFEIRAILGVGGDFGIDSPAQGSSTMIDEWGYPPIGVVICDMPSGGHDAVMLDYRESSTEPAVCYIDEDRVPRRVAASFAEFMAGLVDCSQIAP